MKKVLLLILILNTTLLSRISAQGQCLTGGCTTSTSNYPVGTFTPTSSWAYPDPAHYNMNAGNYTLFYVTTGTIYDWTYCSTYGGVSSSWDAQLTLFNNANPTTPLCFSTDVCGNAPWITWTATFTGTVRVLTTAFNGTGCQTNSGSPYNIMVCRSTSCTIPPAPTGIDNSSSNVCQSNTATVDLGGLGQDPSYPPWNGQWQWSTTCHGTILPGGTGADYQVPLTQPAGSYTYYLWAHNACGNSNCVSSTVNITATVTPSVSISPASSTTVCPGHTVSFTATPTNGGSPTYQWWLGGANVASGPTYTTPPLNSNTTVYCIMTSTANCTEPDNHATSATTNITVTSVTATASSNSPVCSGATLNLSSSGGNSYSWSGPPAFNSQLQNPGIPNAQPSQSGTYTVTVTGNGGCTATATTSVTINQTPTVSISASSTNIASGQSVTLTASGATNYSWSNGLGSGSPVNPSPTSTTTYTVTGTSNGCSATASVTINVTPQPGCSFSVTPLVINTDSNGTVQTVNVTQVTGSNCSWSASVSGNCPWLSIVNGSGSNSGSFTVNITPNTGVATRTCQVNIDTLVIQITQTGYSNMNSNCPQLSPVLELSYNGCDLAAPFYASAVYEWQWNGQVQQSGSSRVFSVTSITSSGYYTCKVTIDTCLYYSNDLYIEYNSINNPPCTTDINDPAISNFFIQPNPSTGKFMLSLETNNAEQIQIKVFDVTGQIIKDETSATKVIGLYNKEINLSKAAKGIYLLQLTVGDNMVYRKIEIQ